MHWQTKAYSKHKALDELYQNFTKSIDKIAESLSGAKQTRITLKDATKIVTLQNIDDADINRWLNTVALFLANDFDDLVGKDAYDLLNIRDEMLQVVNQTIYLCSFA